MTSERLYDIEIIVRDRSTGKPLASSTVEGFRTDMRPVGLMTWFDGIIRRLKKRELEKESKDNDDE